MKFSLRSLLVIILVLCMGLTIVVQEFSRRRLDAQYRYAVWHIDNAQSQISAALDEDEKWRSSLIKKYGDGVEDDQLKACVEELNQHTLDMRLYLSDAWLLTGWDSRDEENSPNGPPK